MIILVPQTLAVEVPKKWSKWIKRHRQWPVIVQITETTGRVLGGDPYRLHVVKDEIKAVKETATGPLLIGTITECGVFRPISDAARHDLGLIRAVIFKKAYPAPVAYEMMNGDFVHPGKCFNDHPSVQVRRVVFTTQQVDDRCNICEESFE